MSSPVDFSSRALVKKVPMEQNPLITTWNARKVRLQNPPTTAKHPVPAAVQNDKNS